MNTEESRLEVMEQFPATDETGWKQTLLAPRCVATSIPVSFPPLDMPTLIAISDLFHPGFRHNGAIPPAGSPLVPCRTRYIRINNQCNQKETAHEK